MNGLADVFDQIGLFHGVRFTDVERLAGYFQVLETSQDQILFKEGEPGDALYIVLDGKIEVIKRADSAEQSVSVEGPGKMLGEMALLDGEARSATCTVIEKGNVAVLTLERFAKLEKEHPGLALRFMKLVVRALSRRLRMTTGRLSEFLI